VARTDRAAAPTVPRPVVVVHHLAGRTRLRIGRLPLAEEEAAALTAALAPFPGVAALTVDRRAASVLCHHDGDVAPARLAELAAAALVPLTPGGAGGPPAPAETGGTSGPSGVAREVTRLFRSLDQEVRAATEGRLDLGTLTTIGFLGAGALEVAVKQRLPAPPWFNLAWWGVRTFLSLEGGATSTPSPGGRPHDE
jgi:hypothetical protein